MRPTTIGLYVAKMFAARAVVIGVGLLVLIQSLDVIGHSNEILAVPGASESALWLYAKLRFPSLVSQFLPFAMLLASLLTLATLSHSSQIVIMKGAGYSAHQILGPMIGVAFVAACLHFWLNENFVVAVQQDLESWQATGYGAKPRPVENLRENVWLEHGNTIISAGRAVRQGDGTTFDDVTVLDFTRDGELQTITLAQAGSIETRDGALSEIREIDLDSKEITRRPQEPWQPGITTGQVFHETLKPEYLDIIALWNELRSMALAARVDPAFDTALYRRVSWPLSCVLMPLLAAIAGFTRSRAGSGVRQAAIGLAVGFLYLVTEGTLGVLGNSGSLPAVFAAWAPFALFLAISGYALIRVEY